MSITVVVPATAVLIACANRNPAGRRQRLQPARATLLASAEIFCPIDVRRIRASECYYFGAIEICSQLLG